MRPVMVEMAGKFDKWAFVNDKQLTFDELKGTLIPNRCRFSTWPPKVLLAKCRQGISWRSQGKTNSKFWSLTSMGS